MDGKKRREWLDALLRDGVDERLKKVVLDLLPYVGSEHVWVGNVSDLSTLELDATDVVVVVSGQFARPR